MKFFLLLTIILTSCGDDMKKYSKLGELRILALMADRPEVNSAGNVTITPYLSYPDGGNTNLEVKWSACIDPGITYGAKITCQDTQFLIGNGNFSFDTTSLSNTYYTGELTSINLSLSDSFFTYFSTLSEKRQFNGIDILVIVEISEADQNSIKSFRRIKVSSRTDLNINPTVTGDMLINDKTISSFPVVKAQLSISGVSRPQTYIYKNTNGSITLTESSYISWFSNVGEFQFSRTDIDASVEFDPKGESSGIIVGICRDDRGGVKVITKSL